MVITMESLPEDLKRILGPSEQVQLYISQKIYHPMINVDSVVMRDWGKTKRASSPFR